MIFDSILQSFGGAFGKTLGTKTGERWQCGNLIYCTRICLRISHPPLAISISFSREIIVYLFTGLRCSSPCTLTENIEQYMKVLLVLVLSQCLLSSVISGTSGLPSQNREQKLPKKGPILPHQIQKKSCKALNQISSVFFVCFLCCFLFAFSLLKKKKGNFKVKYI